MPSAYPQRLHPLTIVVEFLRVLGRVIWAIALFLYLRFSGAGSDGSDVIFALIGCVAVVTAVARYLTTTYGIQGGSLIVRTGLLTKQERTIPLDRIQNINLRRPFVHRLLGLVDVQIETASGTGVEASLSALSEDQAEAMRRVLGGSPVLGASEAPSLPTERTMYRASAAELFIAGATENRALAIVGALIGALAVADQAMPDRAWSGAVGAGIDRLSSMSTPAIIGAVVLLLVIGWIGSIVMSFVTYWNFELALGDGRFTRRYGLVNHVESVVPRHRIQLVRIVESPLQRMLGFCKLYAETAGSYGDKEVGGSALMSPLLDRETLPAVSKVVFASSPVSDIEWVGISPRAIRSRVQAALPWIILITAVAYVPFGVGALWLAPGLLLLSLLRAWLGYRSTGYSELGDAIAYREGVLSRTTWLMPCDKVQMVVMSQSPLQRRLGLASVTAPTASAGAFPATIRDLPDDSAYSIASSLSERSALLDLGEDGV